VSVLGGLFLVAHGLVHLAIWLPAPREDARLTPATRGCLVPFGGPRTLAVAAGSLFALAGVLVVAGADAGAAVAMAGAVVSFALVLPTFYAWLLGAVVIAVSIAAVAFT
jgi:hypothetical protein